MGRDRRTTMNRSTTPASASAQTTKDAADPAVASVGAHAGPSHQNHHASSASSSHALVPHAPLLPSSHESLPSSPTAIGTTATCMADRTSGQGNKTVVMPAYSPVTVVPSGQAIPAVKARIGRDSNKSDVPRTLINGAVGDDSINMDAGSRQEHSPQGRDKLYRGSSVANPDATPISDKVVELLLSEQDRIHILREIQVMERRTIIARVLGIRPSRADLRLLLQAALKQDVDNIVDVQMLGRNYYQLKFELDRMVPRILERKAIAVKGGWVSFHKWIHNFSANQVLHELDSLYTCMVVFPNLRKEWTTSIALIAATIGTVLEVYDKPRKEGDKKLGAISAKILVSKTTILPSHILLPNLLDSTQSPYSQKIMYRGLPNQCFRCFGFGHLAKHCPKFQNASCIVEPSTAIIPYKASSEGWTIVENRKTSRQSKVQQLQPNNLQEFPPLHNKYTTLQVDGNDPQVPLATESQPPTKISSLDKLKQKEDDMEIEIARQGKQELQGQQKMVDVTIQRLEETTLVPTTDNNKGESIYEKKETMEVELLLTEEEASGFKFGSSKDRVASQELDKAIKEHRVHKYAGKDLITKRQIRAQEGAKKSRQDILLEKRTSSKHI